MNRIFNFSRFGRYLVYDLRNAWNNAGFTLLVYGLAPIFFFFFYEICCLVFSGYFGNFGLGWRIPFLFVLMLVCFTLLPARLYGRVTDRRYGTEFLMLPASTFEKFLSMVIVTAVVMPLCLSLMLLVSDTLLGLIFGALYGEPLLFMDNSVLFGVDPLAVAGDSLYVNFFAGFLVGWWIWILFFILGSVFFKKSKVAKTLLSYLLISMVLGVTFSAILLKSQTGTAEALFTKDIDIQTAVNFLNVVSNVINFLISAVLLGLIYWRLRALKH